MLIFALIKDSLSRKILTDSNLIFYSTDTLVESVIKHKEIILQKSELDEESFDFLFDSIMKNITIVKMEYYNSFIGAAKDVIGKIDIEDVPFVALALSMTCDGIWSDNNHFK